MFEVVNDCGRTLESRVLACRVLVPCVANAHDACFTLLAINPLFAGRVMDMLTVKQVCRYSLFIIYLVFFEIFVVLVIIVFVCVYGFT